MKKIALRTSILAALVFLLCAGTASAGGAGETGTAGEKPHGVVEYFDGNASINGAPVELGQVVQFGDRIQTGDQSSIEIVFNSKNIIRLSENSVAVFQISSDVKRIDLHTGTFSGVFARLSALGGSGQLLVRTPSAVGGVRGTTFFVKVIDGNTTDICACNGVVDMQAADDGQPMRVAAPHHEMYQFTRADTGFTVTRPHEMYHTDADMNALARKIDVKIPWGQVE